VDSEGQPKSGLTAEVVLLSKPNYLADWSNEQLFRFGQSANTSAQLSVGKGYPGDYTFALKVAGEPGPIFNITVPNHGALSAHPCLPSECLWRRGLRCFHLQSPHCRSPLSPSPVLQLA